MFYDIVRKLPEGAQIVIEGTGDRAVLTIRAGRSRFTLADAAGERLPRSRRRRHDAIRSSSPAADLKRLIDKTQFAISTEETRYYLNGIYLHAAGTGQERDAARGGDRRPSPGAVRIAAAGGRRRHAGHHRAAQDGRRSAAADRDRRRRGRRSNCRPARSASPSATWC